MKRWFMLVLVVLTTTSAVFAEESKPHEVVPEQVTLVASPVPTSEGANPESVSTAEPTSSTISDPSPESAL